MKIGFIGCGEMAQALITGLQKRFAADIEIYASVTDDNKAIALSHKLNISVSTSNNNTARAADILFIATPPNVVKNVLTEISELVMAQTVIVSVAAGISLETINSLCPNNQAVRLMPNIPVKIKRGLLALSFCDNVTAKTKIDIINLLSSLGEVIVTEEKDMDTITALAGSGTAFFYKIIEYFSKSGADYGLSKDTALSIVLQTALGSVEMLKNTNCYPEKMLKQVATPGGCTYEGLKQLEGIDKYISNAVKVTSEKAKQLGKNY